MGQAEEYTVFVKNSIAFPSFGKEFVRNNILTKNSTKCIFDQDTVTGKNNGCAIFKLGKMVAMAGGNFSQ